MHHRSGDRIGRIAQRLGRLQNPFPGLRAHFFGHAERTGHRRDRTSRQIRHISNRSRHTLSTFLEISLFFPLFQPESALFSIVLFHLLAVNAFYTIFCHPLLQKISSPAGRFQGKRQGLHPAFGRSCFVLYVRCGSRNKTALKVRKIRESVPVPSSVSQGRRLACLPAR